MSGKPDGSNFFSALHTTLSRRDIADLYVAIGWSVRKCTWDDYEIRCPWAEMIIEAEFPILMQGAVSEIRVEELIAPLRAANISFEAEFYGLEGELLRDWTRDH